MHHPSTISELSQAYKKDLKEALRIPKDPPESPPGSSPGLPGHGNLDGFREVIRSSSLQELFFTGASLKITPRSEKVDPGKAWF